GFRGPQLEEKLAALQSSDRPFSTMMDAGVTALDVWEMNQDISNDPARGTCHTVNPEGVVVETGEPFQVPPKEVLRAEGRPGGIGNAGRRIGEVLANEERERNAPGAVAAVTRRRVMSLLGPISNDAVGQVYKDKIRGVDTELLRPHPQMPGESGVSVIRVHGLENTPNVRKGDRAIVFRPGVNRKMTFTEDDLFEIYRRRPGIFHFSYPGFGPEAMDSPEDDGQTLAWVVDEVQKFCPIVSVDVHGPTELCQIRRVLPCLDMVNGNLQEIARILCGIEIDASKELSTEEKMALLERVLNQGILPYLQKPTGRTRLFTVTDARGCFAVLQPKNGQTQYGYLLSPFADIKAENTTGAGDVRCGFQRWHIACNAMQKWQDGTFAWKDAALAVQVGNGASAFHIQSPGPEAFEGVTLGRLEHLAQSGRSFSTIEQARAALARRKTS
ncbi:MAG: carbohydrate kinase family protein, partial [Candidatus Peribacteraceae bacterium]|nr:carbohydrate kinase family protein [Candidatus Peribacteraceae bacterium]